MSTGSYIKETLLVYKTADETINNSAALQDDDHLTLPLEADIVHVFDFKLFISMNTGGIQLAVNGPALTNLRISGVGTEGTNPFNSSSESAYNTAALTRNPGGAVTGFVHLSGYIVCSAAGNLILRWAQNAAVANDTIIQQGSWFRIFRL